MLEPDGGHEDEARDGARSATYLVALRGRGQSCQAHVRLYFCLALQAAGTPASCLCAAILSASRYTRRRARTQGSGLPSGRRALEIACGAELHATWPSAPSRWSLERHQLRRRHLALRWPGHAASRQREPRRGWRGGTPAERTASMPGPAESRCVRSLVSNEHCWHKRWPRFARRLGRLLAPATGPPLVALGSAGSTRARAASASYDLASEEQP